MKFKRGDSVVVKTSIKSDVEGECIAEVLKGIDSDNEQAAFVAWDEYLSETLNFPFSAMVAEPQDEGPLQSNDRVTVKNIETHIDESWGLLVKVKKDKFTYIFPLADLEVIDKKSENFQPLRNYVVWFANR